MRKLTLEGLAAFPRKTTSLLPSTLLYRTDPSVGGNMDNAPIVTNFLTDALNVSGATDVRR